MCQKLQQIVLQGSMQEWHLTDHILSSSSSDIVVAAAAEACDIWQCDEQCNDSRLAKLIQQGVGPFIVNRKDSLQRRQSDLDQEAEEMGEGRTGEGSVSVEAGNASKMSQKILTYNRKQKSLSELTRKFVHKFEHTGCTTLVLDSITQEMNVERRRIYDIINIMESLNVVKKIRKNNYRWNGLIEAVKTIKNLESSSSVKLNQGCVINVKTFSSQMNRKQKSLESLATEFLKLFAGTKQVLTLEEISNSMLSELVQGQRESKKTKVRRLYDIANVFKCLGLIQKVKIEGLKPGYRWIGCQSLGQSVSTRYSIGFRQLGKQDQKEERKEVSQPMQEEVRRSTISEKLEEQHITKFSEPKKIMDSLNPQSPLCEQKNESLITRPQPLIFCLEPNESYFYKILCAYQSKQVHDIKGCIDEIKKDLFEQQIMNQEIKRTLNMK